MDAPNSPKNRVSRPSIHPAALKLFLGVGFILLAGLLGAGGWKAFKVIREKRVMTRARAYVEAKDYTQAAMTLQWALQLNPNNVEAAKLLANTAEKGNAKDAIQIRRKVAELDPQDDKNYLSWAEMALKKGDPANAKLALDGMRDAGLENGAYWDARARLADATGHPEEIEPAMAQAVRLEPTNALYRLRLASMQLGGVNKDAHAEALATTEELTADPTTRRAALRVLHYHALGTRDSKKAMEVADRLLKAPEAVFEDRLVYLGIMQKAKRWEFWWELGVLEAAPDPDPFQLTEVLRWLVRNGLSNVAADWGRRMPNERRLRAPVSIALSEAHTILQDWEGLRPLVKAGEWGDLDFQRHALLARVLREQNDEPGSRAQWNTAVAAASDREDALATLVGLSLRWKWHDEHNALLWVIARTDKNPKWALDQLLRQYLSEGKTRELLSLFNRYLEIDPKDAEAKNNVAYASLLLNTDLKRAQTLAAEAYKKDPANPGFAATYAFALNVAGKPQDGMKIIQAIPELERTEPANALSCGLVLAANGQKDDARKYLDRAATGKLLPQEKALLSKAIEKLGAK